MTEIAKSGGVSQQAVSNALNGNRIGRVKVVPAICNALGLTAKDAISECQSERDSGKRWFPAYGPYYFDTGK